MYVCGSIIMCVSLFVKWIPKWDGACFIILSHACTHLHKTYVSNTNILILLKLNTKLILYGINVMRVK